MKPRSRRALVRNCTLVALAIGAWGTVPACQSGGGVAALSPFNAGAPSVTIQNTLTVPVRVTMWTTERRADYAQTWRNMRGRVDRIDPGKRARFVLREYELTADPVLRIEVQTRGATFDQTHTQWFEALSQPPFSASIAGAAEDLRFEESSVRIVGIPEDRVLDPGRRLIYGAEARAGAR